MTTSVVSMEKKYHIDSFNSILEAINGLKLDEPNESITTHYYAHTQGKDVQKLVDYGSKCQLHILKERYGRFELAKRIEFKNISEGFQWLKSKGCRKVDLLKMFSTVYNYKNGTIGLYEINGVLKSVILYYPEDEHSEIATTLGLSNQKQITVAYNIYLRELGSSTEKELK